MLDTVMVPLDGSEFARQALPRAVSLARRADAGLLLVRVHRGFPAADPEDASATMVEADRKLEQQERDALSRAAEELREEGLAVEASFEEGAVGEALARRAEAAADLVVMSTHGRGGLSRLWLGSVADELARTCSVPLFFVRPEEDGEAGPMEASDLGHVLVPLDGSRLARQALEPAVTVGSLYGARYTLVRVVEPVVLPGYAYGDLPEGIDADALQVMEETATSQLETAAGKLRERGLRVEIEIVRHPSVPRALLEAAERLEVDLIALATHGRGALKRMVLGSVADKMLRGAEGPLLLTRPRGAE